MVRFAPFVVATTLCLSAQTAPSPAGYWGGTIDLRQKQVRVSVGLNQTPDGKWAGTVVFPDTGGTAAVLTSIIVKGTTVSLQSMEALCGLDGITAADGNSIKGEFASAQLRSVPVPMLLKRVSGPPSAAPTRSTPISDQVQGAWQGTLKIPRTWEGGDPPEGITLQLKITLSADAKGVKGSAAGIFPNQPAGLPVTAFVQDGDRVQFEVKAVAAVYKARLKDGKLTGQWSQFNSDPVEVTFKKM